RSGLRKTCRNSEPGARRARIDVSPSILGVIVGSKVYDTPSSFAKAITPALSNRFAVISTLAIATFNPWDFRKLTASTVRFNDPGNLDRKSTRLNSSHLVISYA